MPLVLADSKSGMDRDGDEKRQRTFVLFSRRNRLANDIANRCATECPHCHWCTQLRLFACPRRVGRFRVKRPKTPRFRVSADGGVSGQAGRFDATAGTLAAVGAAVFGRPAVSGRPAGFGRFAAGALRWSRPGALRWSRVQAARRARPRYASFLRFPNVAKSFCGNELRRGKSVHYGPKKLRALTARTARIVGVFRRPPLSGVLTDSQNPSGSEKRATGRLTPAESPSTPSHL